MTAAVVLLAALIVIGGYHFLGAGFFDLVGALLILVIFVRFTVFSGQQARRMRWRVRCWLRPGPGFATLAELWLRWGRLSAVHHGGRARPSLSWWRRLVTPATRYAIRLGRGPYGRRLWARREEQTLILAPPRTGKSGLLADRVVDHPGAALVTESRPDILTATSGFRARLGPIEVFNPEHVAGIPSTFRWAITDGCHDPAEATRRATDLVGAVADTGEMRWWVEKSATALAAAMHAAGLTGDDMTAVWAWANNANAGLIRHAQTCHGASDELFGALAELDRPGKTADSIRITMSKALGWLSIPDIRHMVTGPAAVPFDVPTWVDSCGTIYLLAPGGDQSPEAPLFRCFASHVHRRAKLHGQTLPHRRLDPGLLFALDELHLCPVDLPHWMADSAGNGVEVVAVIHSTGQLKDKYGEAGYETVWSTAGTKIFLPGIHDARTLNDVSLLCGTLPGHEAGGRYPVAPVEFLARMPDWRALVIRMNLFPAIVKFRPAWRRLAVRLGRAPAMPYLRPADAPLAISPDRPVTAQGNGHGRVHDTRPMPWPVDAAAADDEPA
jgi:hypothetical protein